VTFREVIPMVERRRCKRFPFTIPVNVYGRSPRNHPFRDVTATMAVSLYGGLLDMKPRVKLGQEILVVNTFTQEERECRVVYVDSKQRGRRKVAVEFVNTDGDFWHVYSGSVRLEPAARRSNAVLERLDSTSDRG
jgi:PilZ domain